MLELEKESIADKYKFKDFKIYSSTEWLADNKKKYRQVFECTETAYLYVELSIINRMFEIEAWDAPIKIACYRLGKTREEICKIDVLRQISKHDHISFVREGWGNKRAGSFWKKGRYVWEVFIDDTKLMSKYFYLEDVAKIYKNRLKEALEVKSVLFYEASLEDNEKDQERVYYTSFSAEETRYIFLELTLENHFDIEDWNAEIFIKYYNGARELKGEMVRLQRIKAKDENVQITAGWGSNLKGSWRKGYYEVEIVFQDELLAKSGFTVTETFEEGNAPLIFPELLTSKKNLTPEYQSSVKAIKELHQLVGLYKVKKQIDDHAKYIKFLRLRNERGFSDNVHLNLHSVFTGNPGTGKTTIARLLGTIYKGMGLLTKGHVHEVDRVDLVGEFIGQTAPKVREAINKAKGGVLFIDEAYALARNNEDSKDFGREVIEILVKEMGSPDCDFMVVVAGYPEAMKNFIDSNPGLQSRFKYYYDFEDYRLTELIEILDVFCQKAEVELSPSAKGLVEQMIKDEYRVRDKSFGNARYVETLLEKAKINMGIRLMSEKDQIGLSDDDLKTIVKIDVLALTENQQRQSIEISIDEALLKESLDELSALIGLSEIKKQIHELVDVIRFRKLRREFTTGGINMHTILLGNPGTGKTTVTRILSQIFKALGILEKGHIVETDRQGLIAGYVGQTAIKTKKIIDESIGGLLFIDEAYSLIKSGSHNDFGDEAVQILLKQMEDRRGEFFVFVAGYPKPMEQFLNTNPGLKSRFDNTFFFEDFTVSELYQIALKNLSERDYKISKGASAHLLKLIQNEYAKKDREFGNARRIRQIINELIHQQQLRLGIEKIEPRSRFVNLVKVSDVENTMNSLANLKTRKSKRIGF